MIENQRVSLRDFTEYGLMNRAYRVNNLLMILLGLMAMAALTATVLLGTLAATLIWSYFSKSLWLSHDARSCMRSVGLTEFMTMCVLIIPSVMLLRKRERLDREISDSGLTLFRRQGTFLNPF